MGDINAATHQHRLEGATPWALAELQVQCQKRMSHCHELCALPHLSPDDIQVLGLLGEGGFSSVYKVHLRNNASRNAHTSQVVYAMKRLRSKRVRGETDLVLAAIDLCLEAITLSKLKHTHIISLRGVHHGTNHIAACFREGPGYFLLMEVLSETLGDRLKRWSLEESDSEASFFSRVSKLNFKKKRLTQHRKTERFFHRIEAVALPLAQAMAYLHEQGIFLRDLKPQNIGFTENGTLKIFDFGMARSIVRKEKATRREGHSTSATNEEEEVEDNSHDIAQEVAGTWRYMAPEVIVDKGPQVGLKADVYAFGVLLWELSALQKPYSKFVSAHGKMYKRGAPFQKKVVFGGWRPPLTSLRSRPVRRIIAKCWDPSPPARPSFQRVWFLLIQALKEHDRQSSIEKDSRETRQKGRLGLQRSSSLRNVFFTNAEATETTAPRNHPHSSSSLSSASGGNIHPQPTKSSHYQRTSTSFRL